MIHRRWSVLASLPLFVGACVAQADLIVDGHTAARHDRFAGGGSIFIGSGSQAGFELDFSGVGRGTNGFWATMISPTHFVSANHAHATGSVVFHHDNTLAGPTTTRNVIGGVRIGSTDIWVGKLDAPVGPDVAIYTIALDDGVFLGDEFYQVGRGTLYGADNTTGFRVGRNVISLAGFAQLTNMSGDVTADTASIFYFDDSTAGDFTSPPGPGPELIDDETFLQGGDSGAPSFLLSETGQLLLVGTHTGIIPEAGEEPFDERRASVDSYLPFYRSQILTVAVPEGSAFLFVALAAGVMWFSAPK